MPGKDGTGPAAGRQGRRGTGAGPSGYCICPKCGEKIIHTPGVSCVSLNCPKCNTPMIRGN